MESNWFVGADAIDHNNEIEGTNSDIKKTKVLRDKQKLGAFIQNAISNVQDWSKKDDLLRKAELLTLQNQTDGFQFMSKNTDKSSIVKVKEKFYTLSNMEPEDLDLKAKLKKFLTYQKDFDHLDCFNEWKF